jgi:acyl-CoA thioesterase FadM
LLVDEARVHLINQLIAKLKNVNPNSSALGFLNAEETLGVAPVTSTIGCQFLAPAFYPDAMWVISSVDQVDKTSFVVKHSLVSEEQRRQVAVAQSVVAVLNLKEGGKAEFPQDIHNVLLSMIPNSTESKL